MTEIEVKHIDILPSLYVEDEGDTHLIKSLFPNGEIRYQRLSKIILSEIKNPKYLLVGVKTGVGVAQLNVVDANEYEQGFKNNWNELL